MNMALRDLPGRRSTSSSHVELRLAKAEDAAMIAKFLGDFFALSRWADNLSFHENKAAVYLTRVIGSGFAPYLLAMDGKEMVGVCSYHTFDVFTDPIAVMDETYVLPKYKRTDLGRRLVATIIDLARGDGCKVMNFPICSGMTEQNSLMNMIGRHFGAHPVGMIFRKLL
jgi:GNAT superfamily N-acetyltransferase